MINSGAQHFIDLVIDTMHLIPSQMVYRRFRVDARLVEDFIGVNVADASHYALVHQGWLDHAMAAEQKAFETIPGEIVPTDIWSEVTLLDELIHSRNDADFSQLAGHYVSQCIAIVEMKCYQLVLRLLILILVVFQVARHTEVQQQPIRVSSSHF